MHAQKYTRAVLLAGFPADEQRQLAGVLAQAPLSGPAYFCLHADSLQTPDITIVNGDDLNALTALAAEPTANALIIGPVAVDFAHAPVARPVEARPIAARPIAARPIAARPIEPNRLFGELAMLARVAPPPMHERRRHPRLDLDLTDPAGHLAQRRAPPSGAVLIVDTGGVLRDHVASLLAARTHAVEWTDSAMTAERLCEETPVSVVLINTATPGIDPYGLCAAIKGQPQGRRIAVVLLVGPTCIYDAERARAVGVRGMLDKPVADRHLMGALQRLLSLPV